MLRPYDLLENVLIDIEKGTMDGVNVTFLAEKYALSERHLQRLFNFAFIQSLADYIRSRKLAASLGELLKTNFNLIDIALNYGFSYEQSFIRAFKSEFGMTYNYNHDKEFSEFMPAIQVVNFNDILEGFSKDTFEASLCVRFRYIVQRSYLDINRNDAYSLYEAVSKFNKTNHCKYTLLEKKVYFIRIDTSLYDGTYCQMEWFTPVVEKN